jgi:sulfonate transport system substrate-binding protein
LVLIGAVAAACGSNDDESSEATAGTTVVETTAAPTPTHPTATSEAPGTTEPPALEVAEGTTIRVGDQQGTLERPLRTSGQIDEVQSALEFSTFIGGPPLLEAFNAGAVDLGYVGDTPPILANARGQDIVIVGAWRFSGKVLAVVAAPGKEVDSVADLAGKTLAYPKGTALQAFALQALDEAGLTEADITNVDVPAIDVIGVLQSGDVDAAVVVEPLLTAYLRDNPEAKVIRDATDLATGLQFLITTRENLEDPNKAAAIGDVVQNIAASFVWAADNPDEAAQAFADANQISLDEARLIQERNGVQLFVPIDDDVIAPLQALADLFAQSGTIPEEVDVSTFFDDRFNPYVAPYTAQ